MLFDAAERSQEAMNAEAATRCAPRRSPATPTGTCEIQPTFSGQTFKHILVPVWLLTYNYGAQAVPGRGQRLYRADGRRLSEERLEDAVLVLLALIAVLIFVMLQD